MNIWMRRAMVPVVAGVIGFTLLTPALAADDTEKVNTENVVVTATRNEMDPKDAPGAITVITRQEIEETSARDLTEIIRDQAGVMLRGRTSSGRKTITFRGLNDKHTLILINGMRISASNAAIGHSDLENNWVPIENIERIEVVRGPLSALYGSEAMGGVINIITKKAHAKWSGSVQAKGGMRTDGDDGETSTLGVQLSGPVVADKLSMNLSAEYSNEEPTPKDEDAKLSEIEGKEVNTATVGLTYTPSEKHSVNVFVTGVDEERENHSKRGSSYYTDVYDISKYQFGANIQSQLGPTDNTLKLYRSYIEKKSTKTYESGTVSTSYDEVINDVADLQSTFNAFGTKLTLGGEARKEELSSPTMVKKTDDATHTALFFQDELILMDRLSLTTGLRWDHHDAFGSETSPRIYGLYKFTDYLNFKLGYGHAFNAPTIKQVSADYHASTGPHEFLGNPDLKPETADNYEAGVELYLEKFQAKLFYFHNDIDNMIEYEYQGKNGSKKVYKAMNISKAQTQGVETEFGVDLPHGFNLSANYTYLDAKDKETNERLSGKARHNAGAKLRYRFTPWGLWASLRCDYNGEMRQDDGVAPDYTLWHFSMGKEINEHLELKWGVDNIGDVRLADKSDVFDSEERGRTVWAGVTARF